MSNPSDDQLANTRELPAGRGPGLGAPQFDEGDRYQVLERLGVGGMGAVYLCRDVALERDVAIKLLIDQEAAAQHRFVREAQVSGQLEHPGIAPIHDIGRDRAGQLFFVMKRIQGKSLDVLARRGRRTLDDQVETLVKVCEAVGFAHSRGVIHRDLKPANVMVGAYGEVLVLDWGLWRSRDDGGREPAVTTTNYDGVDPGQTIDGQILGTPHYMPPEQARGELDKLSPRSDVYALGALLYWMITGKPPHAGRNVIEVLKAAAGARMTPFAEALPKGSPPPPQELVAICRKAMARAPRKRYTSVDEMREDLLAYRQGHAVSVHRDSALAALWKWTRRNRAVAAVIAAVLLTALIVGGAAGGAVAHGKRKLAKQRAQGAAEALATARERKTLTAALEALAAADLWRIVALEDPAAATTRLEALELLGRAALNEGDWELARHARREIEAVEAARGQEFEKDIVAAEEAGQAAILSELEDLFERVRGETSGAELERALVDALALDHPRRVPLAIDSLRDPREHVRSFAARLLGQLGASAAEAPLSQLLDHPDDGTALLAAETLAGCGGVASETAIERAIERRGGAEGSFAARVEPSLRRLARRIGAAARGPFRPQRLSRLGQHDDALAALPATSTQIRARVRLLLAAGRHRLALTHCDEALEGGPDVELQLQRMRAVHALGRTIERGEGGVIEIPRSGDWRAPALRLIGRANRRQGYLATARLTLQDARAADPMHPEVHVELGELALQEGNSEEAVGHFGRAAELSRTPAARIAHGRALRICGRARESVVALGGVISDHPEEASALLERARSLAALKSYEEALRDLDRFIEARPTDVPGHLERVELLIRLRRADQARREAEARYRQNEEDPLACRLMVAVLGGVGEEEALQAFLRRQLSRGETAWAHYELGNALMINGKREQGARHLTRAIELGEGSGRAYLERGFFWATSGKPRDALADFQRAIEHGLVDRRLYGNLGTVLLELRRYETAEVYLRRALALDPSYDFAMYSLAAIFAERGRPAEARQLLTKLLKTPGARPNWIRRARELMAKLPAD